MKSCNNLLSEILKLVPAVATVLTLFVSCSRGKESGYESIPKDSLTIAKGKSIFNEQCSGCHGIRRDGIGPKMEGITEKRHASWLHDFIKDPAAMIASGDTIALKLMKNYPVQMPGFPFLKSEEINAIIAYLDTRRLRVKQKSSDTANIVKNPLADSIVLSELVVNLVEVAQFPVSGENKQMPLTRISKLEADKANRLFVNDLRGKLYQLREGKPFVFMDFMKIVPGFINKPGLATGLGSFAFHPAYQKNKLLYTTHTESPKAAKADFNLPDTIEATVQWVLMEWKVTEQTDSISTAGRELFRVNMVTGIHGVQDITFNPLSKPGDDDYGHLYIGIGDGGSVESDYPFLVNSKKRVWGTVLRIDPTGRNADNGKYGIPVTNPFVADTSAGVLKEIYAYGFRNPHRITWTKTGKMLVFNIGQAHIEAIDLVEPGKNYGWPIREGRFISAELVDNRGSLLPLPENDRIYSITYPVVQYDHDEGIAISGGFEYEGKKITSLKGKLLFGDIVSGRLFYVHTADIQQGKVAAIKEWRITFNDSLTTLKRLCGNKRVDLHFGKDAEGEIYIMTKTDGKLYKLESIKREADKL